MSTEQDPTSKQKKKAQISKTLSFFSEFTLKILTKKGARLCFPSIKTEPSISLLSNFLFPNSFRVSETLLEKSQCDFKSPRFCKRNSRESRRLKYFQDTPRLSKWTKEVCRRKTVFLTSQWRLPWCLEPLVLDRNRGYLTSSEVIPACANSVLHSNLLQVCATWMMPHFQWLPFSLLFICFVFHLFFSSPSQYDLRSSLVLWHSDPSSTSTQK